jgi:hypothetical protein
MAAARLLEINFAVRKDSTRNGSSNARYIGYVVDALALTGDEGRGKLR